ncbi:epoxide hydrolase N-terminal domain-containing protein [Amycolatopsis sp. lyj-109]|uniref:epoxide hydrolase N-terminal domain-containing protein n=1 Tax=Amycolatopsis sp. lyj-109 TaxID=2789287 RepID=UPI00397A1D09
MIGSCFPGGNKSRSRLLLSRRHEERRLNSYPQFRSVIDGLRVHYVHQRAGALPVLVLHGRPGSFVQLLDLLPLLAAPPSTEERRPTRSTSWSDHCPGSGSRRRPRIPG